jgi:hypothetical protein
MIAKKRRRRLGKKIRQETGLPFTVCMQAAKLIDRGDSMTIVYGRRTPDNEWRVPVEFIGLAKVSFFPCGPECCGSNGYDLIGPKGKFHFN